MLHHLLHKHAGGGGMLHLLHKHASTPHATFEREGEIHARRPYNVLQIVGRVPLCKNYTEPLLFWSLHFTTEHTQDDLQPYPAGHPWEVPGSLTLVHVCPVPTDHMGPAVSA